MSGDTTGPDTTPVPPDPGGRASGTALAGPIDVLDRAGGSPGSRRSHRTAAAPVDRWHAPLRRLALRAARRPTAARRRDLVRRLVGRLVLWAVGPQGEHLARERPVLRLTAQPGDPHVRLWELPGTSTSRVAAPSPAAAPTAAPRSAGPAPTGTAWPPPGPRSPSPPRRPCGSRSRTTTAGADRFRSFPRREQGAARARGDPVTCPVRGSPRRLADAAARLRHRPPAAVLRTAIEHAETRHPPIPG